MSVMSIALAISNLTLGICAALVLGGVVFVVRYGKQCCESVAWIREMCRTAKGQQPLNEEASPDVERPVEELDKEEIAEIKDQISTLSRQIKAILVEIKKMRDAELQNAAEGDPNLVLTEYAMKWEVRRVEFDRAIKALEAVLQRMPKQAVAYRQDTITWIAKARKKLAKCSPEELLRRIKAAEEG